MPEPIAETSRMVMGTNATIKIVSPVDPGAVDELLVAAWARFDAIDSVFSTYKVDSDISRLGRGEIGLDNCHPDVRVVLQLCESVHDASNGVFDIYSAATTMPAVEVQNSNLPGSHPLEPSGMVKGWAIGKIAELFWAHGVHDFCINVGGDVVASGFANEGMPWRIGIHHPDFDDQLMAIIEVHNAAVATSGLYRRGNHIVAGDGTAPTELKSITVVGPDIVLADAYATAAFAMGRDGIDWLADMNEFSVLAADCDGNTSYDEGMARLITLV